MVLVFTNKSKHSCNSPATAPIWWQLAAPPECSGELKESSNKFIKSRDSAKYREVGVVLWELSVANVCKKYNNRTWKNSKYRCGRTEKREWKKVEEKTVYKQGKGRTRLKTQNWFVKQSKKAFRKKFHHNDSSIIWQIKYAWHSQMLSYSTFVIAGVQ